MSRNQTLSGWIEETVDRTADAAEQIHRSIADLPLDVLERNGLFVTTAARIRRIQDRSIEAVYDVVRQVNRGVGGLAADLLGSGDASRDARRGSGRARPTRTGSARPAAARRRASAKAS